MNLDLLKILCCPETKQKLVLAEPPLLTEVNRSMAGGALKNRAGAPVTVKIEEGLLREDRRVLYPVRNGIPLLLAGEGIELEARRP